MKPDTILKERLNFSIKQCLYARCLAGVSEQALFAAGVVVSARLHPTTAVVEKLYELYAERFSIWIITAAPTLFVKGVISAWDWPVERVIGTELYQDAGVYTGEFDKECMLGTCCYNFCN